MKFNNIILLAIVCIPLFSSSNYLDEYHELLPVIVSNEFEQSESYSLTHTHALSDDREQIITDASDVVENIPGVSIPYDISASDSLVPYSNRGFTSFKIRGLGGNRISLTVDGIKQPPEFELSGGMGRTFFDPSIYESVSIRRGAGSALSHSDSIAGSINFESNPDDLSAIDLSQRVKSNSRIRYLSVSDTFNTLFKIKDRIPNQEIIFSSSHSSGHERKNDKGSIPADPVDYYQRHSLVGLKKRGVNFSYDLNAEYFVYESDAELNHLENYDPNNLSSSSVDFADSYIKNKRERFSLKIIPEFFKSDISANILFYYQKSQSQNNNNTRLLEFDDINWNPPEDTLNKTTTKNDIDFESSLLGLQTKSTYEGFGYPFPWSIPWNIKIGSLHDVEDGLNTFNRIEFKEYAPLSGQSPENILKNPPNAFDPSKIYRNEAFFQSTLDFDKFLVSLGSRYSRYAIEPGNDPETLAISGDDPRPEYKNNSLTKNISFIIPYSSGSGWLSYAEAVRNPSMENYVGYFDHSDFVLLPNPNLDPEKVDTIEFGLSKYFSFVDFKINYFSSNYEGFYEAVTINENVLRGSRIVDERQYVNIDDSYIKGVEADISFLLPLEGSRLSIRCTDSSSKNKNTGESLDSVNPRQYIFKLSYDNPIRLYGGSISAIRYDKKENVSNTWSYFIPPASTVINALFYYQLSEKSLLSFGINNILDEKYWLWPNAGRVTHAFSENEELSVMPGRNFILSYSMEL